MQKLYSKPASGDTLKPGFQVKDIIEEMLGKKDLQKREISHEEIDDYLLRLKVTHTPRTEPQQQTQVNFKRDNIKLRRKPAATKLLLRQISPVRLRRPKTPVTSSVQSTARTEAPSVKHIDKKPYYG